MSGHGVLGTFPILINQKKQTIFDFYRAFDSAQKYLIASVNYDITATETKEVTTVIRSSVGNDLALFKLKSGRVLECTMNQTLPVLRLTSNGPKTVILSANQIMTGDSLYFVKDDAINIDPVDVVGSSDFSGSVFSLNLKPIDTEHDDSYFIHADTGIVLHT